MYAVLHAPPARPVFWTEAMIVAISAEIGLKVDHFNAETVLLLSLFHRLQTGVEHGSPGNQGEIIPLLNDAGRPQRKVSTSSGPPPWATVGASGPRKITGSGRE
jgi:hypothetical protein